MRDFENGVEGVTMERGPAYWYDKFAEGWQLARTKKSGNRKETPIAAEPAQKMPEIHINLAQPTAAPVPQSAPHLPAQPYQYSHHNTFGSYGSSQGPHSYIPGYPEHQFPYQNQGQRHPLGRSFNAGAPSSPLQPTSDRVSHLEDFRDWLIVRD